jgi:hypothetical protein
MRTCIALPVGCVHCISITYRVLLCKRAQVTKSRAIQFQINEKNILLFIKDKL